MPRKLLPKRGVLVGLLRVGGAIRVFLGWRRPAGYVIGISFISDLWVLQVFGGWVVVGPLSVRRDFFVCSFFVFVVFGVGGLMLCGLLGYQCFCRRFRG